MRTHEMVAQLDFPKRAPGPFRRGEVITALTMRAENKSYEQIAVALGAHRQAVSSLLARYTDTSAIAVARLRAGAGEAADAWMRATRVAARQGDHKPARDHLAAIGVVRDTPVIGTQVVVVGMGHAPIGEDPWAPVPDPTVITIPSADLTPEDLIAAMHTPDDPEPSA